MVKAGRGRGQGAGEGEGERKGWLKGDLERRWF